MLTTTHTPEQLTAVKKLLLNAWSAEYALRITPLINEEDFLRTALTWALPMAYFSPLFMVRAYLAARNAPEVNEQRVAAEVDNLIATGVYPRAEEWTLINGRNFLSDLRRMRICSGNTIEMHVWKDVAAQHGSLIQQVARINHWHELRIGELLGWSAYGQIVNSLPAYLRDGFLAERYSDANSY